MYKRFTREEKQDSPRARRSQNPTKAADIQRRNRKQLMYKGGKLV
jgi:hypothetical protein